MTVNVYRSTDTSAPVLTGTAGALVGVLDAVLVNGYGSKSAAGWTTAYTATNKRVYTMASGGTGFSIFVDDSGPGAYGGQEARASGWKVPTGLGTGTGQFPSTAQQTSPSGAVVARKSYTTDSTARGWTAVADGHTFYLFTETYDSQEYISNQANLAACVLAFGDFFSYSPTDANNCMIIGRPVEAYAQPRYEPFATLAGTSDGCNGYQLGQFVAGSWTGLGGPLLFGKVADSLFAGQGATTTQSDQNYSTGGNGYFAMGRNQSPQNFPYPNGPDGALWLSPVRIVHSNAVRGYLKGIWAPLHDRPLNHDDTFTVSGGNLSGKSMLVQTIMSFVANLDSTAQVVVETSNTWS